MTTRLRAAIAAALPADDTHPDRRTMLASAGAAAILAAIGTPAAAEATIDPDAALIALREPWLAARVAIDTACLKPIAGDEASALAILSALPNIDDATDAEDAGRIARLRTEAIDSLPPYPAEADDVRRAREARLSAACSQEDATIDAIAATPARTLAGLAFKAEVHEANSGCFYLDLTDGIMADIAAIAAAASAPRI